jgi:acyl dehydratase
MARVTLYLSDLVLGQAFECGAFSLTAHEIKAFAERFDPQPWHLDEELAKDTYFQGLCASGVHSQAAAISLVVRTVANVAVVAGGALQEARFFVPVRPDQRYTVSASWKAARASARNPSRGVAELTFIARDAAGQPVMQGGITYIISTGPA